MKVVDLGCVFIGHGLSKDFRTISKLFYRAREIATEVPDIYVPPAQVLDTVNLYTSEDHKRKLSLRFLSWFLLKKDIQTASHDSIEDARYALLLYKLWKDFKRDDRLSDVMDDIFFEGHKTVSLCYDVGARHNLTPHADSCRASNHLKIARTLRLQSCHLLLSEFLSNLHRLRPVVTRDSLIHHEAGVNRQLSVDLL